MSNANAPTVIVTAAGRVDPLIGGRGPQANTDKKGM